jgi:hypothetical protein
LSRYIENARAGEVVAVKPDTRHERTKGRSKSSSDTLSEDDMKE